MRDIPGQYPHHEPGQGYGSPTDMDGNRPTCTGVPRISGQLREVHPGPSTGDCVSGISAEFDSKGGAATTTEVVADTRSSTATSVIGSSICENACKLHRQAITVTLAIYPAPLHYRSLQQLKHRALQISGYDSPMTISPSAQEDLEWWINNLGNWNGRTIQRITPEIEIETDASKMGWGAYCNRDFTGSQEEKTLHFNALELIAAIFGVQAFCKDRKVTSVMLKLDNATVVVYVNKMGGTKSLLLTQLVKDLWHWCPQRHIHLRAQHLPGRLNFTVDFLSHHLRDRSNWILNRELFSMINSTLEIDLFATRFSTCLPRFVT